MKISSLLLLTALPAIVLTRAGFAQKPLHVTHGCAYKTAAEDTDLYTFESSAEAERIVSEICNVVGLSQNFDIRASNVENAMAVNDGSRRMILYSNLFLKKFNEDARTRWAAYSVLAHEIGHHLNNHDFGEPNAGKRKTMELEADRFSGSALRQLGASLDEAKAGIETFALQGEQAKHPSAKARLEALATGWNQQQERLEKMGASIPTPDSNIPRERDTDGDGIPDRNDACPEEYGRSLTAGCPDADEDGIPDSEDKCRYLKGPAQWKGCPDSDGDGLPDHEDRCPKEPGQLADGGCPPPDKDGDSVTDRVDKCPDAYGLARYQGCPDTDGDGVPDNEDKCPKERGHAELHGCIKTSDEKSEKETIKKIEKNKTNSFKFIKRSTMAIQKAIPGGSHYLGITSLSTTNNEVGNSIGFEYSFFRDWGAYTINTFGNNSSFLFGGPTKKLFSSKNYAIWAFMGVGTEFSQKMIFYELGFRQYIFAKWLNISFSVGSLEKNTIVRFGMGYPFFKHYQNKFREKTIFKKWRRGVYLG